MSTLSTLHFTSLPFIFAILILFVSYLWDLAFLVRCRCHVVRRPSVRMERWQLSCPDGCSTHSPHVLPSTTDNRTICGKRIDCAIWCRISGGEEDLRLLRTRRSLRGPNVVPTWSKLAMQVLANGDGGPVTLVVWCPSNGEEEAAAGKS